MNVCQNQQPLWLQSRPDWAEQTAKVKNSPIHEAAADSPPIQGGGKSAEASAWSPLRHPLFRALWIATVVSNIGAWKTDSLSR